MQQIFQNLFRSQIHSCLGARLEPLTLGHIFLLRGFNSPYILGGAVSIDHFLLAVFICCQRPAQATIALNKWWLPLVIRLWVRRRRKKYLSQLKAQAAAFDAYFEQGTEQARLKFDLRRETKDAQTPWEIRLLAWLMHKFHLSEAEALSMSLVKVNALWIALAEIEGKVELWSDQDQDFWEFARAMDRKKFGAEKPQPTN